MQINNIPDQNYQREVAVSNNAQYPYRFSQPQENQKGEVNMQSQSDDGVNATTDFQTINRDQNNMKQKVRVQKQSKKLFQLCFRCIHIILVITYSIATVIVFSVMISNYPLHSNSMVQLDQLMSNWQLEAIEQVEIQISPLSCSTGFSPFISYQGQSYLEGCNCYQTEYSNPTFIIGTCTTDMQNSGCIENSSLIGPIGIYWKTPDNIIFTICVKRMSGVTYLLNGGTIACEKQCGGSTDETKFCVKSGSTCPINQLTISNTPVAGDIRIGASGGYYLHFSTTATSLPIVESRVNKGLGVCLDNKVQNLYFDSFVLQLLNTTQTHYCSEIDTRFTSISTLTERILLQSNSMHNTYTFPHNIISLKELYGLYVRTYIPLKGDRRNSIATMKDLNDTYNQTYSASLAILITGVLYFVFVGIICCLLSSMNILSKYTLSKNQNICKNQTDEKIASTLLKRLILKFTISVVHLATMLAAFILVLRYNKQLSDLSQGTIGDSYTVSLLSGLRKDLTSNFFWHISVSFVYYGVIMMLESLIFISLYCKKFYRNQKSCKKPLIDDHNHSNSNNNNNNNYYQNEAFNHAIKGNENHEMQFQPNKLYSGVPQIKCHKYSAQQIENPYKNGGGGRNIQLPGLVDKKHSNKLFLDQNQFKSPLPKTHQILKQNERPVLQPEQHGKYQDNSFKQLTTLNQYSSEQSESIEPQPQHSQRQQSNSSKEENLEKPNQFQEKEDILRIEDLSMYQSIGQYESIKDNRSALTNQQFKDNFKSPNDKENFSFPEIIINGQKISLEQVEQIIKQIHSSPSKPNQNLSRLPQEINNSQEKQFQQVEEEGNIEDTCSDYSSISLPKYQVQFL